jgi:hypothetical protein
MADRNDDPYRLGGVRLRHERGGGKRGQRRQSENQRGGLSAVHFLLSEKGWVVNRDL